eukprot:515620-Prymnesium_polylepis.1
MALPRVWPPPPWGEREEGACIVRPTTGQLYLCVRSCGCVRRFAWPYRVRVTDVQIDGHGVGEGTWGVRACVRVACVRLSRGWQGGWGPRVGEGSAIALAHHKWGGRVIRWKYP